MPLVVVVLVSLVLGALTSLGQTYLPDTVQSVANSTGSWTLIALCLSLLARRAWVAVALAVLAFVGLLAGYEIASQLRFGYGLSSAAQLFWIICALIVGPAVGLLGAWGRRDAHTGRSVAVGAVSGLLVGEGSFGLTVIADTTSPVYWALSILAGVAILVVVGWWKRGLRQALLASAVTAVTAIAFWAVAQVAT